MLKFLKNLLKKEEIIEKEEVKEVELEDWLKNKISRLDFQEEINAFYQIVEEKKELLGEKIEILENSEFDEKQNVEEKIKNIVLGHKDNYVNATKQFLENISFPEERNISGAIEFSVDLNKALDFLSQRTAKSYQAAQHLFFNPVEDVFNTLRSLNSNVLEFNNKLEKKGVFKIEKLKEKINLLNELQGKRKKLQKEIGWKEEKLARCLEGKTKHKKEISKLKQSEDYEEFKILQEKEENIKDKIKDNKDEIYVFFSNLERVLRKYERICIEPKKIKEYLDNSIKALLGDVDLKILNILESLEKSLVEIETDEKKRTQIRDCLSKANRGFLKELQNKNEELQTEKANLNSKLRRYNIEQKIEEAEYKLDHFGEQITKVRREIDEWKVKLNSLDGLKLKADLFDLIKKVFKIEIKLS